VFDIQRRRVACKTCVPQCTSKIKVTLDVDSQWNAAFKYIEFRWLCPGCNFSCMDRF